MVKADAKSITATDERIAREKAEVEADICIKELVKNITDLQKVLDVKIRF
ncbi:MAG: hypothetical protein H7240_12795 [Glaciimonas sp.]|nr:hypothetical protein [Glaciimonas sp.]